MDIANLREDYTLGGLTRSQLASDPFAQFERWFQQACDSQVPEPNAMVLSTVSATGEPFQRTVLLKYFDAQGFVFFTNYGSRKAQHIAENAQVSLLFVWLTLERQIHISGRAAKIPEAESFKYFSSRPRSSQIGAWCSPQSSVIESRQVLEQNLAEITRKFEGQDIPLPPAWGGFRVVPHRFEFWQGRSSRLHDRFLYSVGENGGWGVDRLAP